MRLRTVFPVALLILCELASAHHTVKLTWHKSTSVVDGHKVYRPVASGTLSLIATIGDAEQWIDEAPPCGQAQQYKVSAFVKSAESFTDPINVKAIPCALVLTTN